MDHWFRNFRPTHTISSYIVFKLNMILPKILGMIFKASRSIKIGQNKAEFKFCSFIEEEEFWLYILESHSHRLLHECFWKGLANVKL